MTRRSDYIGEIQYWMVTPPWDNTYHYWNGEWGLLGQEPHGGMTQIGTYLAIPLKYAEELALPLGGR